MARPDPEPPGRCNQLKGFQQVGQIRKGFAHPHEYDVVDLLAAELLGEKNLPCDFVGDEVAGKAIETRGAELAAIGAANL